MQRHWKKITNIPLLGPCAPQKLNTAYFIPSSNQEVQKINCKHPEANFGGVLMQYNQITKVMPINHY